MDIHQLLKTPLADRDDSWEVQFLGELCGAKLRVVRPEPLQGPDGWPYLLVSTAGEVRDLEPVLDIARWLSTRGMGMVINPEKPMPDYVLSFGMVWNFIERGEFLTRSAVSSRESRMEIRNNQRLLTGPPSTAYLPTFVRKTLREFLSGQKVVEPKVLMISEASEGTADARWDLAFSLESLGSPPEKEHQGIAEALSWFLPAHYSVALVSERVVSGFSAL